MIKKTYNLPGFIGFFLRKENVCQQKATGPRFVERTKGPVPLVDLRSLNVPLRAFFAHPSASGIENAVMYLTGVGAGYRQWLSAAVISNC